MMIGLDNWITGNYGEDQFRDDLYEEVPEPQAYGCPVLGHDCYEERCKRQCRMCAFSWEEMAADRQRQVQDATNAMLGLDNQR